ncbi:MAG TPA: glycogen debranching N-terminal domain-containing protein [Actinopolymorphaceae bacterium]
MSEPTPDAPRQPWMHDLVTTLAAPTVVLADRDGQIRQSGVQGVLHAGTRVLSRAELRVGGAEPVWVKGFFDGGHQSRATGLLPWLGDAGPDPTVRLERRRTVRPGLVEEQIGVISSAASPVAIRVELAVAADLARIERVKGGLGGPPVPPTVTGNVLNWSDADVQVTLGPTDGAATVEVDASGLAWTLEVSPGAIRWLSWELRATSAGGVGALLTAGLPDPRWEACEGDSVDERLLPLVRQSLADLAALRMAPVDAPGHTFLAAGAPWFCTLFGRDSIWAARLLLPLGEPALELAAGTLRTLAARQGTRVDDETGEAPGKIPHELRYPEGLYYGTVDATPLWVCLVYDAWRAGLPATEVQALMPNLVAALHWMSDHGDADGDGFLEYVDTSGRGLANQGWKDSWDAIRFADGRHARPPIALCEVQGYAYEAAVHGAELLDEFTDHAGVRPSEAADWRHWAEKLAERFRAAFWVEDERGRYPALALDADKAPVDAVASNMGHLLGTGLLDADESALVANRVTSPELDSGFGLRTMSIRSAAYWPLSYHCGSVWPHDTAIVIRGLLTSGHGDLARGLVDGFLDAATYFDHRLPELFSGDDRAEQPRPVPYPAACRPQAWSAAGAVTVALAHRQLVQTGDQGRS